jgi:enoyl-CoA hydratase/carnithine racemase
MNDEPPVRVERSEGWASVVLNRPHRKNAITGPLMDQLGDAVTSLSADTSVAAIVIRGEGGAFCSGVDLTELQADPPHPWAKTFSDSVRRAHIALFNCACPIVVALERYGINAGTSLALSGDLLVAGERAFLQIGEIRQGAHIPMNAAWMQIKSNEHVLARMALLGDRVAGSELLPLGLVHKVVADDKVRSRWLYPPESYAPAPAQTPVRNISSYRG